MPKHTAHILNEEGDVVLTWDPHVRQDRENVEEIFHILLEKGYEMYAVNEEPGKLDAMLGAKYSKTRVEDTKKITGKLIMCKKLVVAPAAVLGGYPKPGMNKGRL